MRIRPMTLVVLALATLGGLPRGASAQLNANLGALTDENARGYLGPLPKALSGTLNTAIFQTGHVPRSQLGFQVELHAMTVSFDNADRVYRPTDPPGFHSTEDVQAPTIIGDTQSVEQQGQAGTVLYHPGGFDLDNFALAVPQLTVGSFMGTLATVRWISVDLGDADLGDLRLFGIGLEHSVSQYFIALPVDLAVGGFYQEFNIGDKLIDSQMFHLTLMGSKRFGVLEPYAGIGYDTFDMTSEYTRTEDNADVNVSVDFNRQNNAHLTTGLRLNLVNFTAHAEFNAAAEIGFAIGFSFGM